MVLKVWPLVFLALAAGLLPAQERSASERLWRSYLGETVRRGLPLVADPGAQTNVYWPAIDRSLRTAQSLDAHADAQLVEAWISYHEGDRATAAQILRSRWPKPETVAFSPRAWGSSLFSAWDGLRGGQEWVDAWLAWPDKVYVPGVLAKGIETLEKVDSSAVVPLLTQARQLYPEDHRFISLALRHPETAPGTGDLVSWDRELRQGLSDSALIKLLRIAPAIQQALISAGYSPDKIKALVSMEYGPWVSRDTTTLADGTWSWDADNDGSAESRIVWSEGHLRTWTRLDGSGGVWVVQFAADLPQSIIEYRSGARCSLDYEKYPTVKSLEYTWGSSAVRYRFPAFQVSMPLWRPERWNANPAHLPMALAEAWLPLNPQVLASKASSIETTTAGLVTNQIALYQGQVWLSVEDTNGDGKPDQWSYFRNGRLASVYRNLDGAGQATLREIYQKGELTQVQKRADKAASPIFSYFPEAQVQLWDPHTQNRPLDRVFVWSSDDRMQAVVFSGSEIPWSTQPVWEAQP